MEKMKNKSVNPLEDCHLKFNAKVSAVNGRLMCEFLFTQCRLFEKQGCNV